MRVLIVHGGYGGALAGATTMAERTAAGLAARGHDVALVGELDATPPWRPDVVHAVDLVSPAFARLAADLAARAGCPLAVTPASAPGVWDDGDAGLDVCRRADVVFVLSAAEGRALATAGVAPGRLVTVGQAPDLEGTPDPDGFRQRHGIDGPMVLYVGRKARFKGYWRLLAAAPAVWQRRPDTRLVFVGPDWDADAAEVMASCPDPRVLDLGATDGATKHDALAACDLVCLPSTADVFPLVFAEAWTCGKPVVSGDFDGATDVVRDGVDGLVVPRDPAALAEALTSLLDDDARRLAMGAAGRARAARELTWDAVTDRIEAGYRRVRTPAGVAGS